MADVDGKKRIVIASVLKPVDDTRMTGKIGRSLADTGEYDIHIIGYPSEANPPAQSNLTFHPTSRFKRLSFKRLLLYWQIRSKIIALRPHLLIITTHELLAAAISTKMATGCKVIYDVQENYYRNIRHTNAFPPILRNLIAGYVRLKERMFASAIDHFFLAEQSYSSEASFFGNRFTVVENKVRKTPAHRNKERDTSKILFSGTLSESTGVFIATDLAVQLHSMDPSITLTIIGYCAQKREFDRLKSKIREHAFIKLIGGDRLIPHDEILTEIDKAGAGIISYPPNPSTSHSIPTKLFEYLGNGLPILLIDNPVWVERCRPYQAAVVFDTQLSESEKLYYSLKNTHFYPVLPADVYWESEQSKVVQAIRQLL
jgi:hypothetical protein